MAKASQALTGGLGGAATGAALGSAMPGIGTAIGAIGGGLIGGLGGLFGGDNTNPELPPLVNPVTGEQITQANSQTQSGLAQQQAFLNALQAQNGIGNQSQVYNQLQGVAQGTGPNPAQAALNQATGANVANQAALMAGQRGAGANAGLIARQAANQGANIQQQAAGQGATMQAQQQLGAISAAGQLANQQVGQQQNALTGYNQFAQNNQGQLLGALGNYNSTLAGAQGNVNSNNQNVAQMNANQVGGLINGAGAAATALGGAGQTKQPEAGAAKVAPTQGYSLGANTTFDNPKFASGGPVGPSSFVGRHLMAKGGEVKAMLSPGEVYVAPSKVGSKDPMAAGKKVPGKAKVSGAKNSYANDTVPATLKEGGIVLPRSVTQSKNPHVAAAKFVEAIMSKKGLS